MLLHVYQRVIFQRRLLLYDHSTSWKGKFLIKKLFRHSMVLRLVSRSHNASVYREHKSSTQSLKLGCYRTFQLQPLIHSLLTFNPSERWPKDKLGLPVYMPGSSVEAAHSTKCCLLRKVTSLRKLKWFYCKRVSWG